MPPPLPSALPDIPWLPGHVPVDASTRLYSCAHDRTTEHSSHDGPGRGLTVASLTTVDMWPVACGDHLRARQACARRRCPSGARDFAGSEIARGAVRAHRIWSARTTTPARALG